MEVNVGNTDKSVRALIGAVAGAVSLAVLAGQLTAPAIASPVLGIVALMMLGTAATGSCPAYTILGMNTCSRSAGR